MIPSDFKQILTDFAREVIRNKPENIYQFGVDYFTELEGNRERKTKPIIKFGGQATQI